MFFCNFVKIHNSKMEKLSNFTEEIHIKKGCFSTYLLVVSGKENDSFVFYAPTLNLSGYGNTKIEAQEMLEESFKDFVDSVRSLSSSEKDAYLVNYGFSKEKSKTKYFSKAFIDVDGELQNQSIEDKAFEITNLIANQMENNQS